MASTTRPTNCLTLVSRPLPSEERRKYFDTTTLVAIIDHDTGTSTSGCSKITSPFSFEMDALRFSHLTWSKGWTPGFVKTLLKCKSLSSCCCSLIGAIAVASPDLSFTSIVTPPYLAYGQQFLIKNRPAALVQPETRQVSQLERIE